MLTSFRPYQPDQSLRLPPSPRDWLPERRLVYFIMDTIEALDLSGFFERYEGVGPPWRQREAALRVARFDQLVRKALKTASLTHSNS